MCYDSEDMSERILGLFDKESTVIAVILVIMLLVGIFQTCEGEARARNNWPNWTAENKLDLGRCLRAESNTFRRDWPLVSWCLVKQLRDQPYGRTIGGQIRAHCAVFDPGGRRYNHQRPREIRASTWEEPKHGTRKQWADLRGFVERFTSQKVPDPCPRCRWWAGKTDRPSPNWTCPIGPQKGPSGRLLGNRFCYLQR